MHLEAPRLHEQPGHAEHGEGKEGEGRPRLDLGGDVEDRIAAEGDQTALQDLDRPRVVFEGRAVEARVSVEVSEPPHLGPGGIDADGHDGKEQVHDPDPEILAARRAELETEAAGRGERLAGVGGDDLGRRAIAPCGMGFAHGFLLAALAASLAPWASFDRL